MDMDEYNLELLDQRIEEAEIAKLAKDTAIAGHEVIKFVKRLPVDSLSYPAFSNFSYHNPRIEWSMPGRDYVRSTKKGCEFHFTVHSEFVSCTSERKHYARAKKLNCWGLTCPFCLSNTVLKMGAKSEHRILSFKHLVRRQGGAEYPIKHWIVSPDQEYALRMIQHVNAFEELRDIVLADIRECGMIAGAAVFHPWRQKAEYWQKGPHFHIVGYGFVDTDRFREEHPGWIIKLVHAKEEIRSIRHTVAYLLTHAGVGLVEKTDEEADLDGRFWNYLIPDEDFDEFMATDGDERLTERFKELMMRFEPGTLNDLNLRFFDIDWTEWTMKAYTRKFQPVKYFGRLSRKELRIVEVLKERRSRECPVCGTELCTFHGMNDEAPEKKEYTHEMPVYAFAVDVPAMKRLISESIIPLIEEGKRLIDLCAALPQMYVLDDRKPVIVHDGQPNITLEKNS